MFNTTLFLFLIHSYLRSPLWQQMVRCPLQPQSTAALIPAPSSLRQTVPLPARMMSKWRWRGRRRKMKGVTAKMTSRERWASVILKLRQRKSQRWGCPCLFAGTNFFTLKAIMKLYAKCIKISVLKCFNQKSRSLVFHALSDLLGEKIGTLTLDYC